MEDWLNYCTIAQMLETMTEGEKFALMVQKMSQYGHTAEDQADAWQALCGKVGKANLTEKTLADFEDALK